MVDRQPVHPNRIKLTPVSGEANTYDLEMADGAEVTGDALNKATLLKDATAVAFGLTSAAVPDDVFQKLAVVTDKALIIVQAYETGTTTPIPDVLLSGVTNRAGNAAYTDDNGLCACFSGTASTTISVSSDYINLTVAAQTVATPLNEITYVTLYATKLASGSEVTITSSKTVRFTPDCIIDAHVVGAGHSGTAPTSNGANYTGGPGGNAGRQNYSTGITVADKTKTFAVVVGAPNGGNTTFDGLSANAGLVGGYGGALNTAGTANTIKKYGTGGTGHAGGGGGGGDGGYGVEAPAGGAPFGGAGAKSGSAESARGYGGGGGGGASTMGIMTAAPYYGPGSGGYGVAFVRWRYTA